MSQSLCLSAWGSGSCSGSASRCLSRPKTQSQQKWLGILIEHAAYLLASFEGCERVLWERSRVGADKHHTLSSLATCKHCQLLVLLLCVRFCSFLMAARPSTGALLLSHATFSVFFSHSSFAFFFSFYSFLRLAHFFCCHLTFFSSPLLLLLLVLLSSLLLRPFNFIVCSQIVLVLRLKARDSL